ncbi:uncharacterized protein [Rutidosis leptorrhynchoides]|uniref:uncharacterized protein n=1 Tax=Rutidosis leptorrhynchoides TaxID=125765 RepID=UPI003A98E132
MKMRTLLRSENLGQMVIFVMRERCSMKCLKQRSGMISEHTGLVSLHVFFKMRMKCFAAFLKQKKSFGEVRGAFFGYGPSIRMHYICYENQRFSSAEVSIC